MYVTKVFLVNIRDIQERLVAGLARLHPLEFVSFRQDFRSAALEKLAVIVIVFERDAILFHDVIIHELRGRVDGEASTIGHSKTLRHYVTIHLEIYLPVCDGIFP